MARAKKSKPCIVAGNWKMHKTIEDSIRFAETLLPLISGVEVKIYIAPPFTAIQALSERFKQVTVGAQNMCEALEGAFTGEISALMLKEVGAQFVILGHSERRQLFNESSRLVNKKVRCALKEGLQPLVCIGETLESRKAGKTEEVIKEQLLESLADVSSKQLSSLIIAYEPVWAIGTGINATPEQAQEVHSYCRKIIANKWGFEAGARVTLLYGGSVKGDNVKSLTDQIDIDGVLVGGASLEPSSFAQIINYQKDTATR